MKKPILFLVLFSLLISMLPFSMNGNNRISELIKTEHTTFEGDIEYNNSIAFNTNAAKDCELTAAITVAHATVCTGKATANVLIANGTPTYEISLYSDTTLTNLVLEDWIVVNNFNLIDLTPGIYSLVITDSKGCEVVEQFTVANLDFTLEVTQASCSSLGSAWVTVLNGDPSYKLHIWGDNDVDKEYWVNNSSFQITDIQPGTYNLKILDANGCEQLQTFTVTSTAGDMDFAVEVSAAACGATGSAWVTVTNGAPSYKLHIWGEGVDKEYWVNNSSFQISDIQPGTYNIKIVDANGCEQLKTFTVTGAGSNLDFAIEVTAAACGATGSAWVTVSNGVPSYKVHIWGEGVDKEYWVNNSSFQITDIQPGTYNIKIVDANGCEQLKTFTVTGAGSNLDFAIEVTAAACGATGSAWVTVSNGVPSYKLHIWGEGVDKEYWVNSSSFQISDIQPGTYNIKIVDANGCEKLRTFTVTGAGSNLDFAIEVTAAACGATGSAWVTVSNGAPSYKVHIWGEGVDKEYWVNSNSFQITDIQPGTYNIKIVDANGCEKLQTFTVTGAGSNLDFALEVTAASCSSKGAAWVTVSNGAPSYKVHIWGDNNVDKDYWVNNSSFQITDILPGSYSIKIVDANGCEKLKTFSVADDGGNLALAIESTAATCGAAGSAWVTATGGTGPYVVSFKGAQSGSKNSNSGSFSLPDLAAGTYEVTVTDYNGCSVTKTFTIGNSGGDLGLAIETTAASCGAAGSAWVTATNGTGPYVVSFKGAQSGSKNSNSGSFSLPDLAAGTYDVTVTDYNGCSVTKTFTIGNSGGDLGLAIETTAATCGTAGSAWVTATNGTGPYVVSFKGAQSGSKNSNSGSFSLPDLAAGTYEVTVTDYNGCSKTQTFSIGNSGGNIALAIEKTAASCSTAGSAWVTTSSGTGPYSVSWSGTSSGSLNSNTGDFGIPNLAAGSYTVVVTDYHGCSKSETFTIGSSGGNVSLAAEVTNGSCGTLGSIWTTLGGGQAPYTVSWTGPSSGSATTNLSNYAINSLEAGTYSVTAMDAQGCAKTRTFTVAGGASNITAAIEVTAASCGATGSAWITLSGGVAPYSVNINGPVVGQTSSNGQVSIPNLLAGSYTLTAVDYNGCSITKSFSVSGSEGSVQLGLNALLASCGQPGGISTQVTGGTGAYTISWSGPSSGSASTNSGSYSISNLVTGTYTVTATDYYGCTSSKTTTITQGSGTVAIGLQATNGSCGSAGSIGVTISGGQPNYTVSWTGPSSGSAGASAAGYTIPNLAAGTYTVSVADYYGCSTSKSVTIGNTGSTVAIGLQATNGSCGSAGSVAVTVSGGQPNYTVSWTGPSSGSAGASAAGYTIPSLVAGTYTVTVTDYHGCSTSKNVTIGNTGSTVAIGLQATNGSCGSAGSVAVTISGGQPNYTVSWTGPSSGSAGASAAGYTIPSLVAGTYTVTVADYYGCSTSKTVVVGAGSGSSITATASGAHGSCGQSGSINVAISGGVAGYTISWVGPATDYKRVTTSNYTIPNLPAGTYSLTITDANGCYTTTTATVGASAGSTVGLSITGTNGACGSAGSAVVNITGGTPNYTLSWSGPSSGSVIAGSAGYTIPSLTAGTYTVSVLDANGCGLSKTVTISNTGSNVAIGLQATNGSCGSAGSVGVTISGGQPNYTVSWTGPSSGSAGASAAGYTIPSLVAGTYTVTVTDFNGCSASQAVVVGAGSGSSITATASGAHGSCGQSGSINVAISGGVAGYTISWVGPATDYKRVTTSNYTIPNLPAGTYSLTITDANGCYTTTTATVGASAGSTVGLSITGTNGACGSAGSAVVNITGGTPNYTLSWSGPSSGSVIAGSAGYTIPSLTAGTYTVSVLDANGCGLSKTVTISNTGSNVAIGLQATNGSCGSAGSVGVTIIGGQPNYTVSWKGPSSGSTGASAAGYTIPSLVAGTYTVTVTDFNGCSASQAVVVSAGSGSNITATASGAHGSCGQSGSINVAISGGVAGYTISWVGPATDFERVTTSNYTIPNLPAGTYSLTITDAKGCYTTTTATVGASAGSTVGLSVVGTNGSCGSAGSAAVAITGGTPNYTVSWSGTSSGSAGATSAGYTIPSLGAGNYTVTVTDANGCAASQAVIISGGANSLAVSAAPSDGTCGNTGSIGVTISGGTLNYTVSWSGASSGSATAGSGSYTIPSLAAGDYTITVKDANGCSATTTANIRSMSSSVSGTIQAVAGTCGNKGGIYVEATTGVKPYTVSWSASDFEYLTGNSYTIPNLAAGNYTVVLSDANGCFISKDIVVGNSSNSTVGVSLTPSSASCGGTGSIAVSITGGTANYTVSWSGQASGSAVATSANYTIPSLAAGNYLVLVTDANGCTTSESVTVASSGDGTIDFDMQSNHAVCSAISEIAVTIKSGTPEYIVRWTGPVSNSTKVSGTSYTIGNLTNGTYQISVEDANGCSSSQELTLEGGGGAPTVDFTYSVSGKQVQFKSASSLGTSAWTFGDTYTSTETNPLHTYQKTGTYNVCLDVTNSCGTSQKCLDVVIDDSLTDDGTDGNGNQVAAGASVTIATMSGATGSVLQLPVTVENCGRLATFSGVFKVENESVLAINGISPSAISPQYNRENNTFSFFSTGEGTEITSETVLFYINVELKGKNGEATMVQIVDGRADLEMTCTDGESAGPVTPNITMGEISIGSSLTATVTGQVYTYWGEGIEETQITIAGQEYHSDNMTTELGTYEAKEIPMNLEYKITPSKDGSPLNGISTYGLFVAQKYLLDYDPKEITSPYQVIAMDANCDNRFTTYDLFVLQQLVIGNITEFPDCPSWVFVRADQEFPEDFNDKNVFPYENSYEMMMDQDGEADFVGVKVGDILGRAMASNQSFSQASSRSNDKMPLQVSSNTLAKGEEVELTFTSTQFEDMVSYQLGLQYDPSKLEVVEFVPTAKADLANTIAGVQRNQVNVSWYHAAGNGLTVSNNEALFTLKVRAKEDIENIIDLLTVSDNFESEANSTEDVFGFELLAQDATATGTFELAQNNPNPFNSSTAITFELPVSSTVNLVVRDQFGRTVTTIQQAFEKGKGQLQLDRGDLSAGVYYYTLEAGDFTATKRMLIIE